MRKVVQLNRDTRYAPCWRCAPSLLEDDAVGGLVRQRSAGSNAPAGRSSDKAPFQAKCALVLAVAGQGLDWHRSWLLSEEEYQKFKNRLFTRMDSNNTAGVSDNFISRAEFDAWCIGHQSEIQQAPTRFHGLLHEDVRERTFDKFDMDENQVLSRDEFDTFICNLDREYIKFLLRSEQIGFRAYWGRGLSTVDFSVQSRDDAIHMLKRLMHGSAGTADVDRELAPPPSEYVQVREKEYESADSPAFNHTFIFGRDEDAPLKFGLFAPGWWEDFKYYAANNHSLFGIFVCDRYHPLDWKERLMMEVSSFFYSWLALGAFVHVACRESTGASFAHHHVTCFRAVHHHAQTQGDLLDKFLFSAFNLVPGMLWWQLLFHLYAAPCANVHEAQMAVADVYQKRYLRRASELCAHILVLITCCLPVCYGVLASTDADDAMQVLNRDVSRLDRVLPHLAVTMFICWGRVQAWTLRLLAMFLIPFNPLVTLGNPSAVSKRTGLDRLEFLAVGKWRLQKLRFKYQCFHGLRALENEQGTFFPLTPRPS
ncbi:unnamed protein product [Prorocentrum cordatum]|uniref:EF-hand domain-containing protein n=1 Tax=Prorocentrum cordatum TaxID=2364126 RepID=A0ABN9Y4I9_9DINO|nr:unnamed protein product [Polarella glacialis]